MNKMSILLIMLLLFAEHNLFAQAAGNVVYNRNNKTDYTQVPVVQAKINSDNEITISVNTLMNVKADSYLAIFNVMQVGQTAEEADRLLNDRVGNMTSAMTSIGVKPADIFYDMVSLVPVYEYELIEKRMFSKTYNEIPKGFELQKNIHIRFTDIKILDQIISIATKNEIYDLVKVDYFVHNTELIYDTLRTRSIALVNKKVEAIKKVGIQFDGVYHVVADQQRVFYPLERYDNYTAFNSPTLDASKSKMEVNKVEKRNRIYYNKLPYEGFDIIINPEYIDPVVQFTFSITVKYIYPKPELKRDKEYMLVTPQGEVKTLKLE